MAGKGVARSAASWSALLTKHSQSGLSIAAFCARERLNPASFYQWRSRLTRVASASAGPSEAFVDLGALGGEGRFQLRLDLGGGLVLHLARG
jgi:putative transposase